MDNNLEQIVAALRQIQDDGGDSNFVVFTADPLKNYYIQFVGELAHNSLFGEAVSNEFLEPPHTLTAAQEAQLRQLGWQDDGEGNFYQEWFASDDEERQEIAQLVMQTFVDVYHISPTQPIEIIVNLE